MTFNSAITLSSALFLAGALLAQSDKLAPDLADLDPNESIDVIIQLEDPPSPRPGASRAPPPSAD